MSKNECYFTLSGSLLNYVTIEGGWVVLNVTSRLN